MHGHPQENLKLDKYHYQLKDQFPGKNMLFPAQNGISQGKKKAAKNDFYMIGKFPWQIQILKSPGRHGIIRFYEILSNDKPGLITSNVPDTKAIKPFKSGT
jgi:hypothetical protein